MLPILASVMWLLVAFFTFLLFPHTRARSYALPRDTLFLPCLLALCLSLSFSFFLTGGTRYGPFLGRGVAGCAPTVSPGASTSSLRPRHF